MKNKFTILGCGSSLGSPWITNHIGSTRKKKNIRSRCSAHIQYKNISILIDTSPDIKQQFLRNNLKNVDAVIYTHEHADQTSGIFELRPFFWMNKKKVPIYGSKRTINTLRQNNKYCFTNMQGYTAILKSQVIQNNFKIKKNKNYLPIKCFEVNHGMIKSTAYVFKGIGYISDCHHIPKKFYRHLRNLKYLIIDCLKMTKHPSHFNYEEAINMSRVLKPKKTILTNLHTDLDYYKLKKILPKNIYSAFDGLKFNF
ncbi:MAG: MBL fold hydrolase [Candidatus Pelagibacter sp.]|nr:MBL fold hydrolase [Candidatus Pelagibacter sp.]